jgi:hypothetical protein
MLVSNQNKNRPKEYRMAAPLDPVIAQIIPLLPLRDPETMTPQGARDALRALAASRAAAAPDVNRILSRNRDFGSLIAPRFQAPIEKLS